MAVSQVDRLKNPCRVWMWNSLVAAQPPPSAPATPIRQVMMRPCDLLPGISILASRPAPRPRTIHAMMPITDSLVSDRVRYAVVGHAGEIAVGEDFSRGVLTVLWPWRLAGTVPCTTKQKTRALLHNRESWRVQLPGSGASLSHYPLSAGNGVPPAATG